MAVQLPGCPFAVFSAVGSTHLYSLGGDEDFLRVYGIDLVSGRNIERRGEFLINEAAARSIGRDDAIGRQMEWVGADEQGVVVGVMRDFHFTSLREPIRPLFVGMAFVREPGGSPPLCRPPSAHSCRSASAGLVRAARNAIGATASQATARTMAAPKAKTGGPS